MAARQNIHDGFGGVSLKLLMLELQLHSATSLNDLDSCIRRKGLEYLADINLFRAAGEAGVTEHGTKRLTFGNGLDNRLRHVFIKACNQIPVIVGVNRASFDFSDVYGSESGSPHSIRQPKSRSRSVRSDFTLDSIIATRSCV